MENQKEYQAKGHSGEISPPPQYSSLTLQQYGDPQQQPPAQQQEHGNPVQQQQQYEPPQATYHTQAGYPTQTSYPAQPGYPPAQALPPGYGQTIQTLQYTTSPNAVVTQVKPNNYMGLAIFSCLCCFWPTAIIAIMKANEVDSAFYRGDHVGALHSSHLAKKWSYISIGIGVVTDIVVIIFFVIYFVAIIGSAATYNN